MAMRLTKKQFFKILKDIPKENIARFEYWDGCNEMQGHSWHQSVTAKYVFSLELIKGDAIDLEVSGFRSTTHFENKERLRKKFTKWIRAFYEK